MRRICILLLFSLTASTSIALWPQPAGADVAAPSWWNGDCDANNWNAKAASLGWTGAGAHRLGASYLGVPVCGPRRSVDGAPDVQWSRAGWGHFEWECTELAFRFMALVYGVSAYGANGNTVVSNYRTSYGGGLQSVKNGTVGVAPTPGDIMSFDSGSFGHVAVVAGVAVDSSGNGQIKLLSQNDTVDGWRTLTVKAWSVQPFGSYVPSAWLHDPKGRGGAGIAMTGTTTTSQPSSPSPAPKPAPAPVPVSTSLPAVYLRNKLTTGIADASFNFGQPGDQVLSCDWDGDGRDTPGWFRNGLWGIVNQNVANAEVWNMGFGQAGDVPICGDWDGNGSDNIGVWRAGVFYLRNVNSTGPASSTFAFGLATDRPVAGDWNGDRIATIGVYRDGRYFLRNTNSTGATDTTFTYGIPGDQPLAGDWNGDGKDTIGIWRNTALYLRNSNTSGIADYVFGYGNPGDKPMIGDWDRNGTDELGIFRTPS